MVHWTALGVEPPELAKEIFKLNAPPGAALPEPIETATCCAMALLAPAASSRSIQFRKPLRVESNDRWNWFMLTIPIEKRTYPFATLRTRGKAAGSRLYGRLSVLYPQRFEEPGR